MIELDKKLHKDIKEYCQLNGLVMKDFVNKLLKKAFTIEKYGDKPFAEIKPETGVAYCPYIIDDTVQVILTPGELPEKIKERYSKPISDKFYEHIQVDGLITELEPKMSNLEEEAIEKIKDMVESQVDLPIEIAEAMEEVDFFELLGDEKNDNTRISITTNNENRERVNKTQTTDTTSSTEEKEEIKVVRKKKRKLS